MDDAELEHLLTAAESDRVERKRSEADKDRISEAICAFANDLPEHRKPGVVFVGTEDDGTCANLGITDELLLGLGVAPRRRQDPTDPIRDCPEAGDWRL
jgi:ATP-dependent DNA helicase RecG